MDVLITVCIPFYNDEKYLEYAIQSVINQTYQKWKLVLLDDGSTDNSLSIAKKFLYDSRVELVSDGLNKGLISRLNQSVDLVKTKYYARMDADDIMHPNRLETQLKIMEENPKIDVLGTNAYSIGKNNEINGVKGVLSNKIEEVCTFIHPSVVAKSSWYKKNKYNDKALRLEDNELWYRSKQKSQFYCINQPLLYYREFGGGYYKKYKKSIRGSWQVLLLQNRVSDFLYWLLLLIKQFFKTIVYMCFSILELESCLIKRRFIPLDMIELKESKINLSKAIK